MSAFLSGVRDSIGGFMGSPKKSGTPVAPTESPMGSPDLSQHGTKRKADVYDMPEEDDEVIVQSANRSAKRTPNTNRSRRESSAPNSAISTASRIKRRSRPSGIQQEPVDERVDAPSVLERAGAPDAVRLQPDLDMGNSVHVAVPVAVMDTSDLTPLEAPISATPSKPDATHAAIVKEPKSSKRSSRQATKEADTVEAAAPEIKDEEQPEERTGAQHEEQQDEEQQDVQAEASDGDDIAEVKALLEHKMLDDGTVDILVHWEGENKTGATWEPEFEIQNGASELLFKYWKDQGGRTDTLFVKEKRDEEYHIFKIVGHQKLPKGGFTMEVQWVGYPATKGETSLENEKRVRQIAPELLDEYWDSKGGRSSFLGRRGRATKKAKKN